VDIESQMSAESISEVPIGPCSRYMLGRRQSPGSS
jgi:hypothetical protein